MTKDDLYNKANSSLEFRDLDEFFSQNVCIPKGVNRHPYADVLHTWIEGAEIEIMFPRGAQIWTKATFLDTDCIYRIKPSEPIYEWQCVLIQDGYPNKLSDFMTDAEITDIHEMVTVIKIDQTKQVRQ